MFPSPSETLPELDIGQMAYRGLTFSGETAGTSYQRVSLTGIDTPAIASGDQQRALDQGELVGIDVFNGRDITLQEVVRAKRGLAPSVAAVELDNARQAFGGIMAPTANVEYPLYLRMPSGLFACMCRPRKHNFTYDISMVFAKGGVVSSMWHATDPRFYAAPSKAATVGLGAVGGAKGIKFPLVFPLKFGGGSAGGILECLNGGLFETRPVLTFTGPCTNPKVTNQSVPGEPSLGFNKTLAAGDTIKLGTDFQTALFTPSGSPFGESCRQQAMASNAWFDFPPGLNKLLFTSSDGVEVAGTLTVEWADAYPSL